MEIEFFMPMVPPSATAQEHKITTRGTRPRFYDPPEVKAAREKLTAHLAVHAPPERFDGPVRMLVGWHFPTDEKHSHGTPKTTKPDTDNLQKLLKDCMTRLGFWQDDAQVYCEIVTKLYSDYPGIKVIIQYENY